MIPAPDASAGSSYRARRTEHGDITPRCSQSRSPRPLTQTTHANEANRRHVPAGRCLTYLPCPLLMRPLNPLSLPDKSMVISYLRSFLVFSICLFVSVLLFLCMKFVLNAFACLSFQFVIQSLPVSVSVCLPVCLYVSAAVCVCDCLSLCLCFCLSD